MDGSSSKRRDAKFVPKKDRHRGRSISVEFARDRRERSARVNSRFSQALRTGHAADPGDLPMLACDRASNSKSPSDVLAVFLICCVNLARASGVARQGVRYCRSCCRCEDSRIEPRADCASDLRESPDRHPHHRSRPARRSRFTRPRPNLGRRWLHKDRIRKPAEPEGPIRCQRRGRILRRNEQRTGEAYRGGIAIA